VAWVAKRLRGAKVWVECDAGGQPLGGEDQRASVLYRKGGKRYRAALRNLSPDDDVAVLSDAEMSPGEPATDPTTHPGTTASLFGSAPAAAEKASPPHAAHPAASAAAGAFHVYTDGACTGNPGPMGLGVVILDLNGAPTRRELSEYLGVGTNNIAELTAILRGLEVLPRDRPVVIYSDSAYAIGLLSQNWKAKANQELVARLRLLLREFPAVRFVKVAGHAGVPENERCDELARNAITGSR
jgi:ribonuclease HI